MTHPAPKIFVTSDIHRDQPSFFDWPAAAYEADIIIVAGDLADAKFDIEFFKKPRKPVVIVPGNHDFWDQSRDMRQIYEDMKKVADGTSVQVLWNEVVIIGGVRIIGTPLWTNFGDGDENLMRAAHYSMGDCRFTRADFWYKEKGLSIPGHGTSPGAVLRDEDRPSETFTPAVALDLHRQSVTFIESVLDQPHDGYTVLVTHMAPSYKCLTAARLVDDRYLDKSSWSLRRLADPNMLYVAAYASNLDWLFEKYADQLDLAVHGHIHESIDIAVGSTRVLANPSGRYFGRSLAIEHKEVQFVHYGSNNGFEPALLVRLDDGLSPVLQQSVDGVKGQLHDLIREVCDLAPYAGHATRGIRESVQECIITRTERYRDLLDGVLQHACQALDLGSGTSPISERAHQLLLPPCKHSLYPQFNGDDFTGRTAPVKAAKELIAAMRHYVSVLDLIPTAATRIQTKICNTVDSIMTSLAEQGFQLELKSTVHGRPWRKVDWKLGSIVVDVSEDDAKIIAEQIWDKMHEDWPRSRFWLRAEPSGSIGPVRPQPRGNTRPSSW